MSLGKYVALCIAAWVVGAVAADVISILMGSAYAEATVPSVVGFWAGKALAKNDSRDWASVLAFPVIVFTSGLLGTTLGLTLTSQNLGAVGYSALISAVVAFALSAALFALLKKSKANGPGIGYVPMPHPEAPVSPAAVSPQAMSVSEELAILGIKYDGKNYTYLGHSYDSAHSAIRYAREQKGRKYQSK